MTGKAAVLFERDVNVSEEGSVGFDQKAVAKIQKDQPVGTENQNSRSLNRSSIRESVRQTNGSVRSSKHRRTVQQKGVGLKKGELALETASVLGEDVPQDVRKRKRKRHASVEMAPHMHRLASDSEKFVLPQEKSAPIKYAAPFNSCNEFDPHKRTDEGILLSILAYEFQQLDNREKLQNEAGFIKPRNMINSIYQYMLKWRWLLDPFVGVDQTEYLRRYPWDRFYDPQLFIHHNPKKIPSEHGLNLDMMPEELKEEIIQGHKAAQAKFRFRRQFHN